MQFLNNINDDELRLKLLYYGFPNVPVTETTRPILIKKVYSRMDNKSKASLKNKTEDFKSHNANSGNLRNITKPSSSEYGICLNDKSKHFTSSNVVQNELLRNRTQGILPHKIYNTIRTSESEEDSDHIYFSHPKEYSFKLSNSSRSLLNKSQLVNQFFKRLDLNKKTISKEGKNLRDACDENTNKHETLLTKFLRHIQYYYTHNGFKHTHVSYVLTSTLLLFLILISFKYAFIKSDLIDTIDLKNSKFEICQKGKVEDMVLQSSFTCIDNESIESALDTVKLLLPLLVKRSEEHFCLDAKTQLTLSAKDFFGHLNQLYFTENINKVLKDLHNAEYLISNNVHWGINNVNAQGDKLSYQDVIRKRVSQDNYFLLAKPRLPFRCAVQNKLQAYFTIIGTVFFIGSVITLIRCFYICMQNRKMEKLYIIEDLKKKIIEELIYSSKTNVNNSEMCVNNLREKIIPIGKHLGTDSAWNVAIRNLELFDNRVQFGITSITGEECKTIKWIADVNKANICQNLYKQWHSPAFHKTNKILVPPTSCLKIRQMFDSSETQNPNLKQIIKDSILEKVGRLCKICEIQFDKDSCCVYVRCATEKDAGIVHNEINGWWFDKRLVSIKFLRLQRYLTRFPKSSAGHHSLIPSKSENSGIMD